jgi:putative ABC transport system ATP-binding protein
MSVKQFKQRTGNLDEQTSKEIIHIFKSIAHDQNKTVILATHNPDVGAASDVICELKGKKVTKK